MHHGGSGDRHLGLEPKYLRGMLVSLVLCQKLPASFLGWVLSMGWPHTQPRRPHTQPLHGWLFTEHPEPSLSLSLPGSLWLYLNGLNQGMVVQQPQVRACPWPGSSESPEAKTLECWFRCLCSEPGSVEAHFFGCFPREFLLLKQGMWMLQQYHPRSCLEMQVQGPCIVPCAPEERTVLGQPFFKLGKN